MAEMIRRLVKLATPLAVFIVQVPAVVPVGVKDRVIEYGPLSVSAFDWPLSFTVTLTAKTTVVSVGYLRVTVGVKAPKTNIKA